MSSFVIATRIWKGRKYRTRYYIGMYDGRVRLGTKWDAIRFNDEWARKVHSQLTPGLFVIMDVLDRPPKKAAWPSRASPREQVEMTA